MAERRIRLNAVSDVTEFVRAAERCESHVDVSYSRGIIDAKSIIGVLSLDFSQTLTVKYNESEPDFEQVLNKFSCAC